MTGGTEGTVRGAIAIDITCMDGVERTVLEYVLYPQDEEWDRRRHVTSQTYDG